MDKKISLKDLVANAVHFGHKTQRWNPKMKPYIYGSRNGMHIIDVKKTAAGIKKVVDFLNKCVAEQKNILFVGTKQQCKSILEDIKQSTGAPIVTQKWICGLLTNFKTVKRRIDFLRQLIEEEETKEIEKYTKKEQGQRRKQREKLEIALGGVMDMNKTPDVLFVIDCKRDRNAVTEARKLHIPVVALMDTNTDPDLVDYGIPANDDALKSLTFIMSLVKEVLMGKGAKKKEEKKEEK